MACRDNVWAVVPEQQKTACLSSQFAGQECLVILAPGGAPVAESRPEVRLLYAMVYEAKDRAWRLAFVGEKIDGYLPLEYARPRPVPAK